MMPSRTVLEAERSAAGGGPAAAGTRRTRIARTREPDRRAEETVRAALIDLDGVVYEGERAVAGAAEAVAWFQGRGVPHLFLTNSDRAGGLSGDASDQ